MRIVHVIDSLGASGGAEHGLVREITRFPASDTQMVVGLYEKAALAQDLESAGIGLEMLGLDPSNAGFNWPLGVRKVGAVIRTFQPDVIQSSLFMGNLVAQLAARTARLPVLSTFTLSGDAQLLRAHQPNAASLKASLLRRLASVPARDARVWFRALTEDARQTNTSLLGVDPEKSVVIPRGVPSDIVPVPLKKRSELGLPEDVPIVLNIGRQTKQKGHRYLIEAMAQVRSAAPFHLVLCGREGDTSEQLHEIIAEKGMADVVSVTGYTPDVHHYLGHASVFAFPSLMEGLGTSVLEAMSAGVPVVAFDIPPVREITDNGAHATLTPVGNIEAFASAVVDALVAGPQPAIGEAVRFVQQTYSIDEIANRVHRRLVDIADA